MSVLVKKMKVEREGEGAAQIWRDKGGKIWFLANQVGRIRKRR